MKRIFLSVAVVFILTSTSFAQQLQPSKIWLGVLFPEVEEYMDDMQEQIDRMEATINTMATQINIMTTQVNAMTTQVSAIRNDYVNYQHYTNGALFSLETASMAFGVYQGTRDISDWNFGWDMWDYAMELMFNEAYPYADKLDLDDW